ncbi:hypothetical protein [Candidatus Odyssella acanthamoebae]|uniref:Uncharacterized protein n=1 Tax=Candidatus Odyssella acanthamoebae TaxID=91604 RepID=A0A077AW22_9PROT|nr:hypothetical protein [Candidatus Paracaedibacter acanthamoebae]AIK96596.1 hypothetical protein ID47_07465 [Candidatus Paracaedibacter acanthamoebae]
MPIFFVLLLLLYPCYAMEKKGASEESGPKINKSRHDSLTPPDYYEKKFQEYTDRLFNAENEEEANRILSSIPQEYREEILDRLPQSYSSDSSSSTIAPHELPENLTRDGAEEEGLSIYQQALECEQKGEIEEADKLYAKSANKGVVLSKIKLKENWIARLEETIKEKKAFLEKKESEFNDDEGTGGKLKVLSAMGKELFDLDLELAELKHDLENLQDLKEKNIKIYYDSSFVDSTNFIIVKDEEIPACLLMPSREKELEDEEKAKILERILEEIDFKLCKLEETILILREKENNLKAKEAKAFIQDLREAPIFTRYLDILEKVKNKIESILSSKINKGVNSQSYEEFESWLIEQDQQLVRAILGIIKKYISRQYIFSPLIFNDIRTVREFLLPILSYYNHPAEGDSRFLSIFSNYFVTAQDEIEIPTSVDRLRAQLILLREADRYLQALRNPQKYMKLINPSQYKKVKNKSKRNKELEFLRYRSADYSWDMDFDINISIYLANVRNRSTRYTLWFLNRSYQSFREVSFNDGAPLSLYNSNRRLAGLGSRKTTTFEVSPWVSGLNYLLNLKEGQSYEYVFDVATLRLHIMKVSIEEKNAKENAGHCYIRDRANIQRPCGGNFKKIGEALFRSDEYSGHYGWYWTDKRRLRFLEMIAAVSEKHKYFQVLHEPWMSDEKRAEFYAKSPDVLRKIQNFHPFGEDDKLPKRDMTFQNMSNEDLQKYQTRFISRYKQRQTDLSRNLILAPTSTASADPNNQQEEPKMQIGEGRVLERIQRPVYARLREDLQEIFLSIEILNRYLNGQFFHMKDRKTPEQMKAYLEWLVAQELDNEAYQKALNDLSALIDEREELLLLMEGYSNEQLEPSEETLPPHSIKGKEKD